MAVIKDGIQLSVKEPARTNGKNSSGIGIWIVWKQRKHRSAQKLSIPCANCQTVHINQIKGNARLMLYKIEFQANWYGFSRFHPIFENLKCVANFYFSLFYSMSGTTNTSHLQCVIPCLWKLLTIAATEMQLRVSIWQNRSWKRQ